MDNIQERTIAKQFIEEKAKSDWGLRHILENISNAQRPVLYRLLETYALQSQSLPAVEQPEKDYLNFVEDISKKYGYHNVNIGEIPISNVKVIFEEAAELYAAQFKQSVQPEGKDRDVVPTKQALKAIEAAYREGLRVEEQHIDACLITSQVRAWEILKEAK